MSEILAEGVGQKLSYPQKKSRKSFIVQKRGSAPVRVYWTPDKGKPGWTVSWVAPEGRVRKWFSSRGKAEEFASEVGGQLKQGITKVISTEEMASLQRAREILQPFKVSIEVAAAEWAEAAKRSDRTPLGEILSFWEDHKARVVISLAEAVDEFLRSKKEDLTDEARHVSDLETTVGGFRDGNSGTVDKLTPERVYNWLVSLRKQGGGKPGPQTFNHQRARLLNFLHFARRSRWLSFDVDRFAEDYPPREVRRAPVEIFAPAEMVKLFRAARLEEIPALVLGGFSGLRPSESIRVNSSGLDFKAGAVFGFAGKVRTAGDRVAPLPACAIAWLAPLGLEGRVVSTYTNPDSLSHAFLKLAERAGVKWKHDGLRHSFVSYRLSVIGNIDQVSEETGTEKKTLRKHYRRPVLREVADEWFALDPRKVISFEPGWTPPAWWPPEWR